MPLTKKQAYKKHLERKGARKKAYEDSQKKLVKNICAVIDHELEVNFVPNTFVSPFLVYALPSGTMDRSLLLKKVQDLYPEFILEFDYTDKSNYLVIGMVMKEVSFPNVKPWYSFIKPKDFGFWTCILCWGISFGMLIFHYNKLNIGGIIWFGLALISSSYFIQTCRK